MKIRSLEELAVNRKKVLVRADLDVPLSRQHPAVSVSEPFKTAIDDDFRLLKMLPTFEYLHRQEAKIIVLGDLNRPSGRVVESDRLQPVVDWFASRFPKVSYVKSIIGLEARQAVLNVGPTEILFLENLRFEPGEEENRESFAKELATYGEVYVNECFATSHRRQASLASLPRLLPSVGGFNLQKEVEALSEVSRHARRPLVVIIGGAKLETKIPVIDRFLGLADKILVTGRIGVEIDKLVHYHRSPKLIYSIGEPDILPGELDRFASIISIAGTIVWNGPTGDTSHGYFDGSRNLAELISSSSAKTIVGGGDTNEVLRKFNLRDKFNFVSTGGGAMLEFLSGKSLPGLETLIIS